MEQYIHRSFLCNRDVFDNIRLIYPKNHQPSYLSDQLNNSRQQYRRYQIC